MMQPKKLLVTLMLGLALSGHNISLAQNEKTSTNHLVKKYAKRIAQIVGCGTLTVGAAYGMIGIIMVYAMAFDNPNITKKQERTIHCVGITAFVLDVSCIAGGLYGTVHGLYHLGGDIIDDMRQ